MFLHEPLLNSLSLQTESPSHVPSSLKVSALDFLKISVPQSVKIYSILCCEKIPKAWQGRDEKVFQFT